MNFEIGNIFGNDFAKMTLLETLEEGWKKLKQLPLDEDDFWQTATKTYDVLVKCIEEDVVPKELMNLYTVVHDFAVDDNVLTEAAVFAAIAEAISGFAAYSLVEIPIENARSVRAFCGAKEYIVNLDKKEITED